MCGPATGIWMLSSYSSGQYSSSLRNSFMYWRYLKLNANFIHNVVSSAETKRGQPWAWVWVWEEEYDEE